LEGAYYFGAVFGCVFWGVVADRVGRRPIILLCTAANVLLSLAFGFSLNFTMGVIVRVATGAMAANFPVAKSYLNVSTTITLISHFAY
jgi:MFS family permease